MTTISPKLHRAALVCAALAFVAPVAAGAEPAAPSAPVTAARDHLVAQITNFSGKYGITVRDAKGALVTVQMHRGTVIEPVGLRLDIGMQVALTGSVRDGVFQADRIDVPEAVNRRLAGTSPWYSGPGWGRRDNSGGPPAQQAPDPIVREPAAPH
jgi:hypothetical protein